MITTDRPPSTLTYSPRVFHSTHYVDTTTTQVLVTSTGTVPTSGPLTPGDWQVDTTVRPRWNRDWRFWTLTALVMFAALTTALLR